MVAAVTQSNLEVLFEVIGYPQGKTDPRFADDGDQGGELAGVAAMIERWTCNRTGVECEAVLMRAGVPCSRYRSVAEAMADPQCAERGLFVELGEGDAAFEVADRAAHLMSATPTVARLFVAGVGEDTETVLHDRLGVGAAEAAALRGQGVNSGRRAHDRPTGAVTRRRCRGRRSGRCCAIRCAAFLNCTGRPPEAITSGRTGPRPSRRVWSALVEQGVASLGCDPTEGGLREIAIRDGGERVAPPVRHRCLERYWRTWR